MKPDLTPIMQEATHTLIHNLLASEPFIHYQMAHARLEQEGEACALLDQLTTQQGNLRKKQATGGVTPAEIATLRELQGQVQRNHTITAYVQSQQEAVNFLREINTEISQLLGLDFAAFANHAAC